MLGIKFGFYDPADWQAARKIDWIVDTWGECVSGDGGALLSTLFSGKAKKTAAYGAVLEKKWKNFLAALEAHLSTNQTKFLAGD